MDDNSVANKIKSSFVAGFFLGFFTFAILLAVFRLIDQSDSSKSINSITVVNSFEQCDGYDDLYYDTITGVVYLRSAIKNYCPYYSKYGNLFMWDGSNLVQIPEE